MSLIYFHGFNSDGHGWKFQAMRKHFKEHKVYGPDLPAAPMKVVEEITSLIESISDPCYFVGTSLGGFYAYYFSAKYDRPCFLFNPSLQPHLTLHRGIGHFKTFTKGRDYHLTTGFEVPIN